MYKTYFGLKREPFSVAADPRFIYMSPEHRLAAQHMLFGLQSGAGFVLLTGEVGAGKSMVCRAFLRMLPPAVDVANVVNPRLTFRGLLLRVCEELRIEVANDSLDPIDAIHGHLLMAHAEGRRTLIVVDEAQALSHEVLELLRLLTNLDSTGSKLQIFLIGQPELRDTLRLPALKPVSQRIVARFHLHPLPEPETENYILHRLTVAGYEGPPLFDHDAILAIHKASGGLPRRINVLCDRALAMARTLSLRQVHRDLVEQITPVVFDERPLPAPADAEPTAQDTIAQPAPSTASAGGKRPLSAMTLVLLIGGALLIGALAKPVLMDALSRQPQPAARVAATPLAASPAAAAAPSAAPPVAPTPVASAPEASAPVSDLAGSAFDEPSAWRQLAQFWGEALPLGEPCVAAMQRNLYCHRGDGGLDKVLVLNRPAILSLKTPDGSAAGVLLVGLDGGMALLKTRDGERRIAPDALASMWNGDFATFWRGPTPAGRGTMTAWLHQRFAALPGAGPGSLNDAVELKNRVTQFQAANGLKPDGIPGPTTLMKLNRLSGVMEPVLIDR